MDGEEDPKGTGRILIMRGVGIQKPLLCLHIKKQNNRVLATTRKSAVMKPHVQLTSVMKICRDSSVGKSTGYGLDDLGVGDRVPVGSRIFSSPRRPDWLWGPLSLLYNGYRGLFLRG
jgi:hypothetical protein